MDVLNMTDAEYDLYWQRRCAAGEYRAQGHHAFADEIEAGLKDGCAAMRAAAFWQSIVGPAPSKRETAPIGSGTCMTHIPS